MRGRHFAELLSTIEGRLRKPPLLGTARCPFLFSPFIPFFSSLPGQATLLTPAFAGSTLPGDDRKPVTSIESLNSFPGLPSQATSDYLRKCFAGVCLAPLQGLVPSSSLAIAAPNAIVSRITGACSPVLASAGKQGFRLSPQTARKTTERDQPCRLKIQSTYAAAFP